MRKILFRGKDFCGFWTEGNLLHLRCEVRGEVTREIVKIHPIKINGAEYPVAVDPDSVGEYTGLTDKNGRKIFEGDIICLCKGATYPMLVLHDGLGFKFSYPNGHLKEGCWDCDIMHDVQLCEIIGNIYDNPELWEAEE